MTTDAMGASTLTNPGYTLDTDNSNGEIDGITFNPGGNDSSSELNAVDELALVVVNSDSTAQTDLCNAIGDTGCNGETNQTNQSEDGNQLDNLFSDPGPSVLATEIDADPTHLLSGGTFRFPDIPGTSGSSPVILVAAGSVPEPASLLLIAPGLLALGLISRRNRSA